MRNNSFRRHTLVSSSFTTPSCVPSLNYKMNMASSANRIIKRYFCEQWNLLSSTERKKYIWKCQIIDRKKKKSETTTVFFVLSGFSLRQTKQFLIFFFSFDWSENHLLDQPALVEWMLYFSQANSYIYWLSLVGPSTSVFPPFQAISYNNAHLFSSFSLLWLFLRNHE